MAKTANAGTAEGYAPLADPAIVEKYNHNQRQKAGRLVRQIQHKSNYGISIMAQQMLKVEELQKELAEMGLPQVEMVDPDFHDRGKLEEYAKLSAYQQ